MKEFPFLRGIVTIDRLPNSTQMAVWVSSRIRNASADAEMNATGKATGTSVSNVNAVVIEMADPSISEKIHSLILHSIVVLTTGSTPDGLGIDGEALSPDDFEALADETEEQQGRILHALEVYAKTNPKTGAVLKKPKPITRPTWSPRPLIEYFRPREDTPAQRALSTANYICAMWEYWLSTDEERRTRVESPRRMTPELSSPIVPDFPPQFRAFLQQRKQL
ncbi:MAG: hypothetical protein LBV00_01980 [Propionibacteriaceae bacterium]|nr:hypothetical protein [Propionibacteriaceae bacterium]